MRSLNDPRFRWENLAQNFGSQYGPNNRGLELARADWVAYLGQDDIWHPRHLQACRETADVTVADFIVSACVMYGPPGSGIRSIAGLFDDNEYSARAWIPPSAWMHRKALVERVGRWQSPDELPLPTDYAFLTAAVDAGVRVVGTGELTVFKFNAAWRRDSYRHKLVAEQEAILAKIEGGIDFRQDEWRDVVHALLTERFVPSVIPPPAVGAGARYNRMNRRHRGVEARYSEAGLDIADKVRRFRVDESSSFFEWHNEEVDALHGPFRWSGPLARATASFPIRFDRALAFTIHIVAAIEMVTWDSLKIYVQDQECPYGTIPTAQGSRMLKLTSGPPPPTSSPGAVEISFAVAKTRRPVDIGASTDRRWLGIAVNWVEIGPAPT